MARRLIIFQIAIQAIFDACGMLPPFYSLQSGIISIAEHKNDKLLPCLKSTHRVRQNSLMLLLCGNAQTRVIWLCSK